MTTQQERIAEDFITSLQLFDGAINYKQAVTFNEVDNRTRMLVIQYLKEKGLITEIEPNSSLVRLTVLGWEFKSFEGERDARRVKEREDKEMARLTKEHLKKDIFQLKYWWVLIFINLGVSVLLLFIAKWLGLS